MKQDKDTNEKEKTPEYKQKPTSFFAKTIDLSLMRPGDVFIDSRGRRYMKTITGQIERVKV